MSKLNSKTLVGAVVATALLAVALPAPVAAESGTVSVDGPDSASPGDEVTVSFEITNTGESPSAYILDLSLPADYAITDYTDDSKWNSEDTSWIFQTIEAGDSNTKSVAVDVELPAGASSSDTITTELKTASGIEDTRSLSLIQSGSDEGTVITGEVSDVNLDSMENTGDTEVTISRTDSSRTSGPVLVNSISLSDFNTLASSNSDVISAAFSENGNEPATYSIKLSNAGDLSQYQITADRPGFETFSVTTEPVGVGESIDQNIRFSPAENAQITGNVVDDRNNNLPNAEVLLLVRGGTGTFEQLASTTTDSSGSFAFTGADGVQAEVVYRLEATFVDEDGTERTGSTTLANVSGGTNTADIVIEGVNKPKESDRILEDTVSISGSRVTIETNDAPTISVSDLPSDVQITDVSHGTYDSDKREIQFFDGLFGGLPETVSFTLTPDSDAYNFGDTVEFTLDGSPVSLDVVSQSEVRISSVEFSPETVATDGSTHDLTINVEGLSPDDEADVFTVTIPQDVNVANVDVKSSNVNLVETPTPTNSMTFAVDPKATTTAQIEVELTLEPTMTKNSGPDVSIGIPKTSFNSGAPVRFSADGTDTDGYITDYRWEFGDGTEATGVSPTHSYEESGTYTVSLTATDNDGSDTTVQRTITINKNTNIPDDLRPPTIQEVNIINNTVSPGEQLVLEIDATDESQIVSMYADLELQTEAPEGFGTQSIIFNTESKTGLGNGVTQLTTTVPNDAISGTWQLDYINPVEDEFGNEADKYSFDDSTKVKITNN